MTLRPDDDINLGFSPDNSFQNLYITGKLNYDFSKDEQVYIMLQCNDFEGEYSTSINLEYTV